MLRRSLISSEEKVIKPHLEIYKRLFSKFNLPPESCFFVDDLPVNIEGARMAGMDGAVFCGDMPRLRRNLRRAGVDCAEE